MFNGVFESNDDVVCDLGIDTGCDVEALVCVEDLQSLDERISANGVHRLCAGDDDIAVEVVDSFNFSAIFGSE